MSTLPTPHRTGIRVESNYRMVQRHGVNERPKKEISGPYYMSISRQHFIKLMKRYTWMQQSSKTGKNVQNCSYGFISLYKDDELVKQRRFTKTIDRNRYARTWEKETKHLKNIYIQITYDD